MRVEGNVVHKCIHEAMDGKWCSCDDATRGEYNVSLPKPPEYWCDYCDEEEANYTISMTDSVSMDNLAFLCADCVYKTVDLWLFTPEYEDCGGWEIKRIHG